MELYHGSNVAVRKPRLLETKRLLDFGPGFYATSDFEQAKKWAIRTTSRRQEGQACVSVYDVDEQVLQEIEHLIFHRPDKEWLAYIAKNRKRLVEEEDYDVVIGPVANDQAIRTVNNYLKGYFNEDVAIQLLLPQNLKDQYNFKTERALKLLTFKKVVDVWND